MVNPRDIAGKLEEEEESLATDLGGNDQHFRVLKVIALQLTWVEMISISVYLKHFSLLKVIALQLTWVEMIRISGYLKL